MRGGTLVAHHITKEFGATTVLDGLSPADRTRVYYYAILPNFLLSLHPDYVMTHMLVPLTPDRTRITCSWAFPREVVEQEGFSPAYAVDFWDLTNRQDWELCANAFKGVVSRAWQPGPYADLESQLAAFDRQYLRTLDATAPMALEPA